LKAECECSRSLPLVATVFADGHVNSKWVPSERRGLLGIWTGVFLHNCPPLLPQNTTTLTHLRCVTHRLKPIPYVNCQAFRHVDLYWHTHCCKSCKQPSAKDSPRKRCPTSLFMV